MGRVALARGASNKRIKNNRVNWAHPLAQKLSSLWVLDGSPVQTKDGIWTQPTLFGNAKITPEGIYMPSYTDYFKISGEKRRNNNDKASFILVHYARFYLNRNDTQMTLTYYTNDSQIGSGIRCVWYGSFMRYSSANNYSDGYTWDIHQYQNNNITLGFYAPRNNTVGHDYVSTMWYYINGVRVNTASTDVYDVGYTTGTIDINNNGFEECVVPLYAVFNDVTEAEAAILTANPWQIFETQSKTIVPPGPVVPSALRYGRVNSKQPKKSPTVNWSNPITIGMYTATIPRFGDIVNGKPEPVDATALYASHNDHNIIGQATTGTDTTPINFPRKILSYRTELVFQYPVSRRLYGSWLRDTFYKDTLKGEYIDNQITWYIHGPGWNLSTDVFGGTTTKSLVGRPSILVCTWGLDVNSGYGRVFDNGIEVTRSSGNPQTAVSDRTLSSASSVVGPGQNQNYIYLFAAWDRVLSDKEIASLSANPWQLFNQPPRLLSTPSPITGTPQLLVPISDITKGTWAPSTGVDLYPMLDEVTPDSSDYIYTVGHGDYFEVGLTVGNTPTGTGDYALSYQLQAGTGSGTIYLKQGATTIASWPYTQTGVEQTITQTLTAGQIAAITDYSALRVGGDTN